MDSNKESEQIELITETFKKHFNHFGFKKTSVDDISKELKISKKTIYKFFDTKEKIFYYVISKVAGQFCKQMEKKIEKADYKTSKEKIESLIKLIFIEARKWIKEGNDAFEFKYKFELSELAFKEAYNILFEKIINEGIAKKEFTTENVQLTIKFINGIFSESMRLLQANPDLELEKNVTHSIIKLIK
jgi:AcrR family transcriptional regulator